MMGVLYACAIALALSQDVAPEEGESSRRANHDLGSVWDVAVRVGRRGPCGTSGAVWDVGAPAPCVWGPLGRVFHELALCLV